MVNKYCLLTLTGLVVFTLLVVCGFASANNGSIPIEEGEVSLTVVYDNYQVNPDLTTSWGFGCVVRTKNTTLLFDTGASSSILLSNMEKMGIDPKEIDLVAISHVHGDHLGGLEGFLGENNEVTVYIPSSLPDSTRKMIERQGARYQNVSNSIQISENIYTTGELGIGIKEQSLIVDTNKGLVVVTGCAHPGVVNIANEAKNLLQKELYLVTGGFHLVGAADGELQTIVSQFRELGVKKVAPSHCSGDRCRELFAREYDEDYIKSGVGKVIEVER